MGLHKDVRGFIQKRFGKCYTREIPRGVVIQTWIEDANNGKKTIPTYVKTYRDLRIHYQKKALRLLSRSGSKTYIHIIDRCSPINKAVEYTTNRKSSVVPLLKEEVPRRLVIDPAVGEIDVDWQRFSANKKLMEKEWSYFIYTHCYGEKTNLRLPAGTEIIMQGVCMTHPAELTEKVYNKEINKVVRVRAEMRETPYRQTPNGFSTVLVRDFLESMVNDLGEAEVAAVTYATAYSHTNIVLITDDSDTLVIFLLWSIDARKLGSTGKFFIKFRAAHNRPAKVVDVFALADEIERMPEFKDYPSPIAAFCAACLLSGCDYIKYFCNGVGKQFIFRALLEHSKYFKDLVHIARPGAKYSLSDLREITVDERAIHRLMLTAWTLKMRPKALNRYLKKKKNQNHADLDSSSRVNLTLDYIKSLKAAYTKIQPFGRAKVFSRQLLWMLKYYIISTRTGIVEDPLKTIRGVPVYGYMRVTHKGKDHIWIADKVSKKIKEPIPGRLVEICILSSSGEDLETEEDEGDVLMKDVEKDVGVD